MKSLFNILLIGAATMPGSNAFASSTKPNLLIIHTDEHNFRTLGCYRDQLPEDQAFVWGKGVKVDTPHIDSIARDGALFTSFYAASPVCTPSRASFVTGLYPVATGSARNDMPLHDNMVTFAEILKDGGYATAYIGKWHLDGDAKPGWAPARKFGFEDNRYMFNRGHWKLFEETGDGPKVGGSYNPENERYRYDISTATDKSFATDFLADKAIEIIDRDKEKPFCLMLSLPDPHGPNSVREPYDSMYSHLKFEEPRTLRAALKSSPKWSSVTGKNSAQTLKQEQMADYFGMVKCIDDNVGKILKYLKDHDLEKNTIVVFTSDHGDSMGEHAKHNKGTPWETSAGIPFIIKYPGQIKPGKLVHTAYSTVDFAPTVLGIMGVDSGREFHGLNGSSELLGPECASTGDRIVYITNAGSRWVAAVDDRYKLVISPSEKPWLFDLEKDPDELINFYRNPDYKEIGERLKNSLVTQMKAFKEPALKKNNLKFD
ncbi:sulfatase [Puniceicoccales bacterium CK1056]|uniref:Sulfatase n=1 Tax=Oceanipulchritudo coccoides TaxID=2706888 RepID=A0A6B2LZY9_9BACT|nr:sulfatase [Oceanipulchritudo coccoides]NDV61494.1 sulfatase [Oceanipulchritudo coccoides]